MALDLTVVLVNSVRLPSQLLSQQHFLSHDSATVNNLSLERALILKNLFFYTFNAQHPNIAN